MVFIGPYEHHSNELPWRESIADVVTIHEDADGHIDVDQLAAELERYADRALKIGSFSAASNVTGIVTDTHRITRLLHEHGALALWDVAAAAPYVDIEMNPHDGDPAARKDAIFLSPHKFIGGPGTPGVLVVSRGLLTNSVPDVVGGGTVSYVNPQEHRYILDPAHREEGGTPAIVESIRAGLVFALKDAVGVATIRAHEEDFLRRAVTAWHDAPRHRGARQPRRRAALDRVVRDPPARGPLPAPQPRRRRSSTTCSASRAAAAAPAPAPTATGCSASTSSGRTSSSARSPAAARASSPAGCGSTSTTSSATRSSSTSSGRSRWSPTTATSSCRSTASTR